ncbi:odorant receptor 30a-like [Microplitis demolitor]|uniref:odorant receptor 30a-like n=1 Tax=Microplitis demolitor TaxID=69319 RepID=UPI00235B6827|nr:odorant receptor 30a-like [Microplitis demolitor]
MKQLSKDQKDLDEGLKIFDWSRRVSKFIGLWPLAPNNFIFFTTFSYFSVVMILEWMDFYYSLNDFDKILDNLTENLSFSQIYIRGIILKLQVNKLRQIIKVSMDGFNVNKFKNSSEIEIFLSFINKGKFFVKSIISFMAMTIITWYISPLTAPAPIADDNETIIYILPYRFHVVFEINDFKSYMLTYISYAPHSLIDCCSHASIECFLITLIYYLRGRLVILAGRINALNNKPKVEKYEINDIIAEHSRLLKFGETIISIYNTSLMVYMMSVTVLLCVIGYKILINFMTGPNADLVQYLIYIFITYLIIGLFCIVSERLISECNKVSEAFWNCEWYNMPPNTIKDIMFCILRSQKPLALQIGKFSYFNNNTLTIVTKTAMGYLSVLRHFVIIE